MENHEFYVCYNQNSFETYYVHFPKMKFIGGHKVIRHNHIDDILTNLNMHFDVRVRLGSFRADIRDIPSELMRVCPCCRKRVSGHKLRVYCSDECRLKMPTIKKYGTLSAKCIQCGKDFNLSSINTDGKYHRKYCSLKCQQKSNRDNYKAGKTDMDKGARIKEGREMSRMIQSCGVDCLLSEFGDIE